VHPLAISQSLFKAGRNGCGDITDTLDVCETEEAIGRVQDRNRSLLKAINRERPDLYATLGEAFQARREALAPATCDAKRARSDKRKRTKTTPQANAIIALPFLAGHDATS
jgi:hypothetical protein